MNAEPCPAAPSARSSVRERLAERAAGVGDLRLGVARRQLERELEPAAAREQAEQVVEHGQAGGDVRRIRIQR